MNMGGKRSKMIGRIKVLKEKWKSHENSLFYEGYEEIAYLQTEKRRYSLITAGDIRLKLWNGDSIDNSNRWDKFEKYKLTDWRLKQWEKEGKVEWLNNNWFEVVWTDESDKDVSKTMHDNPGGDNVAYDYDSAIELLKSYGEDEE